MHAGREDLIEVDDKSALIVGSPQEILGQQLRPHPIHLNNSTFILITY